MVAQKRGETISPKTRIDSHLFCNLCPRESQRAIRVFSLRCSESGLSPASTQTKGLGRIYAKICLGYETKSSLIVLYDSFYIIITLKKVCDY